MKNMKWLTGILFLFLLAGCFEDEGKYDVSPLNAPVWKDDVIQLYFRAGETAEFRSSPYFSWAADSLKRASEVTYEWKIGNLVIGKEANFEMPTDEVIKAIGMLKFDGKFRFGTFSIIEKATGITYMKTMTVQISPTNATGDWYVVSENGENTKLSFLKRRRTDANVLTFELKDNVYPGVNEGEILGRPELVSYAEGATNIGAMGALSIVTSSGRYEINCENMVKVGNLEEIPFAGKLKDRHDAYRRGEDFGLQTLVTDTDGKLYRRIMSKNNLLGEFGTAPMVLDAKGYNVLKFGQAQRGFLSIPCYDQLNRRMAAILFYESGNMIFEEWFPGSGMGSWVPDGEQYKLSKIVSTQPAPGLAITGCANVWDMPAGTKPLHIWNVKYVNSMLESYPVMGLIYNDAAGKTWLTEYATDSKTGAVKNGDANRNIEFPGGNLPEDACILTSGYSGGYRMDYILYSKGNEIRFLNRVVGFSDNAFITLPGVGDKVTCMVWSRYYTELMVGTEQGNVIVYNCPSKNITANPEIIKQFNLGGRVVGMKELNNIDVNGDKY